MFEKALIKYDGHLREINVDDLDMNPNDATDEEVLVAIQRHLDVDSLSEFVVERTETVINVRPSAEFAEIDNVH